MTDEQKQKLGLLLIVFVLAGCSDSFPEHHASHPYQDGVVKEFETAHAWCYTFYDKSIACVPKDKP